MAVVIDNKTVKATKAKKGGLGLTVKVTVQHSTSAGTAMRVVDNCSECDLRKIRDRTVREVWRLVQAEKKKLQKSFVRSLFGEFAVTIEELNKIAPKRTDSVNRLFVRALMFDLQRTKANSIPLVRMESVVFKAGNFSFPVKM